MNIKQEARLIGKDIVEHPVQWLLMLVFLAFLLARFGLFIWCIFNGCP